MRRYTHAVLVILILVVSTTFAAAGGSKPNASREMKEGYRAAQRGYWQEALMRFDRANQLRPGDVKILNNLAVALEAVGRYDDALEIYEEARRVAPGDGRLRKNYRLFKEFYQTYVAKEKPAAEAPAEEDSNA